MATCQEVHRYFAMISALCKDYLNDADPNHGFPIEVNESARQSSHVVDSMDPSKYHNFRPGQGLRLNGILDKHVCHIPV